MKQLDILLRALDLQFNLQFRLNIYLALNGCLSAYISYFNMFVSTHFSPPLVQLVKCVQVYVKITR